MEEEPYGEWFIVRYLGKWMVLVVGAMFTAWIALGQAVGAALGAGETGTLAAFWTGVLLMSVGLVWHRKAPTGLSHRSLAIVAVLSSVGAALLAAARLLPGNDYTEGSAMLGLLLLLGPPGWVGVRVVFGAPEPEEYDDD